MPDLSYLAFKNASWQPWSVALLVARRINNRKVAGSRPTKVVCMTVLIGNRLG